MQLGLEVGETGIVFLHLMRFEPVIETVCGEQAGDFADILLDQVQPVATIGDVGGADVFAGWQQVFHPLRQQSAERDLEGG